MVKNLLPLCLFLFVFEISAQVLIDENTQNAGKPICFLDSVLIDYSELTKLKPEQIALITVFKDKQTTENSNEGNEYGTIYIETKTFARKRYTRYLKSKSLAYSELLVNAEIENEIVYIINDKVMVDNYQGDLAAIDDSNFKGLEIVKKKELKERYQIIDKNIGVRLTVQKALN